MELKDRINKEEIVADEKSVMEDDEIKIAIDGIMSLGYSKGEVLKIINQINTDGMAAEGIIREALKRLSKQ